MGPRLTRVILFVWNLKAVAAFYEQFFDMRPLPGATEDWIELAGDSGGSNIALHKAAGEAARGKRIKIVFGVADVLEFKLAKETAGLKFGVVHKTDGFEFADTKDPAGNAVQISSRGMNR